MILIKMEEPLTRSTTLGETYENAVEENILEQIPLLDFDQSNQETEQPDEALLDLTHENSYQSTRRCSHSVKRKIQFACIFVFLSILVLVLLIETSRHLSSSKSPSSTISDTKTSATTISHATTTITILNSSPTSKITVLF